MRGVTDAPAHPAPPAPRLHPGRQWLLMASAGLLAVPAFALRLDVLDLSLGAETVLFGLGILGAAFLLSWAAEVAQLDISQGLAIAFLAFIAVLPEYAVDLVFAWKAGVQDAARVGNEMLCGAHETCRQLAIANMTGANRLLIGLGWAVVVLVWWRRSGNKGIVLPVSRRTELGFLLLGTLWAFTIVIRGSLSIVDTVLLVGLFAFYIWHTAREEQEHPELVGPPVVIAAMGAVRRRLVTLAMFAFATVAIIASAEPFAHGLVEVAEGAGFSPFLAVQWLAPLASEAPEMIIAVLFVLRAKPHQGLGALVSSKVNQWTLLVGTLPLAYAISFGSLSHAMVLDGRQIEEIFLTAAQSLFAVAVLSNLTISRGEAAGLLVLFLAQLGFESTTIRVGFAFAYLALFLVLVLPRPDRRRELLLAIRTALRKPGKAIPAGD